jgi:hypothetical protein
LAWLGACSLTHDLSDITGSSTTAAATGGSSAGGGATTGGGDVAECESATDCPAATSPCETAICLGGQCGTSLLPSGSPLGGSEQTAGDCQQLVCNRDGEVESINDDLDKATSDTCGTYDCNSGVPTARFAGQGTACGSDGDEHCDGAGACVECITAADCPLPAHSECGTPRCDAGVCSPDYVSAGTPITAQTPGDCQRRVCDGSGDVTQESYDLDLPNDDNPCTHDVCTTGTPSNPPTASGTDCGAGTCDGSGSCVGCVQASDCGDSTFCRWWTCDGTGPGATCTLHLQAEDTPLPPGDQVVGDCQLLICTASGGVGTVDLNIDVPPDDSNQCTLEQCINGAPFSTPTEINSVCDVGGSWCDGLGHCVQCNDPPQCPDPIECLLAACQSNTCTTPFAPDGTPTDGQTDGDCKVKVCDGEGGTRIDPQNGDLPVDGNPCTDDVCTNGTPSNPPAATGTPCASGVCDGLGYCVDCVTDNHCETTEYCSGNRCAPDLQLGERCSRAAQCETSFCVDDVCCEDLCNKLCFACSNAKTGNADGICIDVRRHTDPDSECEPYVCQDGGCCYWELPVQSSPPNLPQKPPLPVGPCEP